MQTKCFSPSAEKEEGGKPHLQKDLRQNGLPELAGSRHGKPTEFGA